MKEKSRRLSCSDERLHDVAAVHRFAYDLAGECFPFFLFFGVTYKSKNSLDGVL